MLFPNSGDGIRSLLAAEERYMPFPEYTSRYLSSSLDLTARQDSINWILKVSEFYRFRPVTVHLSVNFMDRFLSSCSLPAQMTGSWPLQLLSVACLSVAAKIEETSVPLLLDIQILNPQFVFDPKSVCRMELLLMSALQWRLRAVTPFDFLPFFAVSEPQIVPRTEDLILCTHRVVDFLRFRPSVIAAAAVLCAASEVSGCSAVYHRIFDDWVKKDVVRECRQLMEEYLIDTCPTAWRGFDGVPAVEPGSPVGVLDAVAAACGSCETQRSSSSYLSVHGGGGGGSAKRRRLAVDLCTEAAGEF